MCEEDVCFLFGIYLGKRRRFRGKGDWKREREVVIIKIIIKVRLDLRF